MRSGAQGFFPGRPCSHLRLGAGVQYDVLEGVLDVLHPGGQPHNGVIRADLFPLVTGWGLRDLGIPVVKTGGSYHFESPVLEYEQLWVTFLRASCSHVTVQIWPQSWL